MTEKIHLFGKYFGYYCLIATIDLDPESLSAKANAHLIHEPTLEVYEEGKHPNNGDKPMSKQDKKLDIIIHLPKPSYLEEQIKRDKKIFSDSSKFLQKLDNKKAIEFIPSKVDGVTVKTPSKNKKPVGKDSLFGLLLDELKAGVTDLEDLANKLNYPRFKELPKLIDSVHRLGYSIKYEEGKYYLVD